MNLIESLAQIKDFRRAEGRRYPLIPMLLIVIMSIICGRPRYREIAKFADADKNEFQKTFNLKRCKMPSHVTFREIIAGTDFRQICQAFEDWAKHYVTLDKAGWLAVDGKAIRSAVTDYDKSYQNFVSLISVFAHKRGQIVGVSSLHNGKNSEIPAAEQLIRALDLQNVIFTADALHCQKKLSVQ